MAKFNSVIPWIVVSIFLVSYHSTVLLAEDSPPSSPCVDHDDETKDPPFGFAEYEKYKLENHHKSASYVDYYYQGKMQTVYDACKGKDMTVQYGPDTGRHYITEAYCGDYKYRCDDLAKLKYQQCGNYGGGNKEFLYCKNCGEQGSCIPCSLESPKVTDPQAMCPFGTICKGGACVIPGEGDPMPPKKPCNPNKVMDGDEKGVDCGGELCPACPIITDDCNEDAKDGGDPYVGGATTYLQDGKWVPPLADSCADAGTLIEYTCDADGLDQKQYACPEGCETVPYTGTKEFSGEVGQCVMQKQCTDNDQWAPVIKAYVLGVEVGSYNTEHSIPSSASVTGKDGKTYDICEDTCIDGNGNPVTESNKLKECNCDGGKIDIKEYTCPDYSNGCKNGGCCFNTEICMDLDGGVQKEKKGNAFFGETCKNSQKEDHFDACGVSVCSSRGVSEEVEGGQFHACPKERPHLKPETLGKAGDAVLEYYCSDFKPGEKGEILSKWLSCGKGMMCLDGACVPGSCKKYSPGQTSPRYDIKGGKTTQPQNCVEGMVIKGEGKTEYGVRCNHCADADMDGVKETHVKYECGRAALSNGDVTALSDLYINIKTTKCPISQKKSGSKGGCIDDFGCIPIFPSDIKGNVKLP